MNKSDVMLSSRKLGPDMWQALQEGMQNLLGHNRSEYLSWFEGITRKSAAQLDDIVLSRFMNTDYRLLAAYELYRRTKAQQAAEAQSGEAAAPISYQQDRETGRVRLEMSFSDWEQIYNMTKQAASKSGHIADMERLGAKTLWKRLKGRERL